MKSKQKKLLDWYQHNCRQLPWRISQDPYRIWISEVMLQQTTVKAAIPFYIRFMERFPTLAHLAQARIEDVYEYWAGLGYYSRARNLHAAAQKLNQAPHGFPKTFSELLEYPGFGPYTSRAVSSIAFSESVGVLDGNVIRFLCRYYNLHIKWWESSKRPSLQKLADAWVQNGNSSVLNQAMMELGATICTPQSPSCFLCPLQTSCEAFQQRTVDILPLKKPRKKKEIWIWNADIIEKNQKVAYLKNNYAPFLKGQLLFPGRTLKVQEPPKVYDYKHNITHHEIYVKLVKTQKITKGQDLQWYNTQEIKKIHPVSLIQKALHVAEHPQQKKPAPKTPQKAKLQKPSLSTKKTTFPS